MRFARAVLLVTAVLLLGAAGPALAQTFVFGDQGEPVQFDPAVITDGISAKITRQIFDTLYEFKPGTTQVQPALAEKAEASADGKTWTLQLRKNVKFHDGEPFDAKAVVWNFERWMNTKHPQHENQLKAGQTFEYFEGQFDGFDDKSVIAKVEATGTHTVKFTLKQPQAPFLQNIAMFPFAHREPEGRREVGDRLREAPGRDGRLQVRRVEAEPGDDPRGQPRLLGEEGEHQAPGRPQHQGQLPAGRRAQGGRGARDRGDQPRRPQGHQGRLEPPGAAPAD